MSIMYCGACNQRRYHTTAGCEVCSRHTVHSYSGARRVPGQSWEAHSIELRKLADEADS